MDCTDRCTYPTGAASLQDPYSIMRCNWNRTDTAWGVSARTCYNGFYMALVPQNDEGNNYFFECIPWTLCRPGEIQSRLPSQNLDRLCSVQLNVTFYFTDDWPQLNNIELSQLSEHLFGPSQVPFIIAVNTFDN
ncbi:hypothetical protein SARC_11691, partial [Sphaeroforma arctica JP610]